MRHRSLAAAWSSVGRNLGPLKIRTQTTTNFRGLIARAPTTTPTTLSPSPFSDFPDTAVSDVRCSRTHLPLHTVSKARKHGSEREPPRSRQQPVGHRPSSVGVAPSSWHAPHLATMRAKGRHRCVVRVSRPGLANREACHADAAPVPKHLVAIQGDIHFGFQGSVLRFVQGVRGQCFLRVSKRRLKKDA